jgi:hypothetical protein
LQEGIFRYDTSTRPKAGKLDPFDLKNLLEEILQAQKNTAQKEAFTRLYQNLSGVYDYMYEY